VLGRRIGLKGDVGVRENGARARERAGERDGGTAGARATAPLLSPPLPSSSGPAGQPNPLSDGRARRSAWPWVQWVPGAPADLGGECA
jgi:hypothetical protein